MKQICIAIAALFSTSAFAQNTTDEHPKKLDEVIINGIVVQRDIKRLDSVAGTYIFSGKKNEVIDLHNKNAALSEKYGRQIFSKIPGVFVYDIDGTGNQTNISTRGLDPHRG